MKVLYLDAEMGAAGDMISGALFSLFNKKEQQEILQTLNTMGLEGVRMDAEDRMSAGIMGKHLRVTVRGHEEKQDERVHVDHHHHTHTSLEGIFHVIDNLQIPEEVGCKVKAVYEKLADAESHAHDMPVTEIHFHEVGTMDAVMDITAAFYMLSLLRPDKIFVSPIRTGFGTVRCAHGILPVPAPATAFLLQAMPSFAGDIEGELCTPTGAAVLKCMADEFGRMPVMRPQAIGYGMGRRETGALNAVRAILGQTEEDKKDAMVELSANIDDMTGEEMGFALEKIRGAGAAEAFSVPVMMKKDRPGILLTAICRPENEMSVVRAIFQYTETIGIRRKDVGRYVLDRKMSTLRTSCGDVRMKKSTGYGVTKEKYEYEDLKAIAEAKDRSIREVREIIDGERNSGKV
ncbi:MAG: nickel pincer cofactor biosynthesis protein LarC [Lachnospiraceae bacterium]|nr:nickel pincer cofactor biosynthesis protein LarC [Lachnospiraceae bacterium]